MAGPAPALYLPLHTDLVFVAQRRRGLLRQARTLVVEAPRQPKLELRRVTLEHVNERTRQILPVRFVPLTGQR